MISKDGFVKQVMDKQKKLEGRNFLLRALEKGKAINNQDVVDDDLSSSNKAQDQASTEHESHEESFDKVSQMVEDSDLPEGDKKVLKEKLELPENKALLIGLIGIGVLSYAPKAEAGVAEDITAAITEAFQEVFMTILGELFGVVNAEVEESSKESQTALGLVGDGINTTLNAIDDRNLQAAVMAPPDYCLSDEIGGKSKIKASESKSNIAKLNAASTKEKIIGVVKGSRVEIVAKAIQDKYGAGTDKVNQHLDPTALTADLSVKTEDGEANCRAFIETLQTPLKDTANIPSPDAGQPLTKEQLRLKARLDSRIARIKMAEQPFFKSLAERRNSDGESKVYLMQADVERTYGDNGSGWRGETGQYANPTPNTQESAKLIAFSNKLAYEALRNEELSCNLQAVILLETLDSEEKSSKINALSQGAR
jgi:hypothetical protein